ncbi:MULTISPECIES: hypothetical protein [Enterococcus]|nr:MULTISPECIES: hypothetical protein [Enterococcus]HAP4939065.1 hypothetical protein [Enterococcus faecalis ADL-335]HAP5018092.1 hypothetical protein [Enterococcus faecalis EX166083VC26]HAP5020787.1 hypothetical protein [Enterococcus faecalis EX166083VC23]HAP5026422.1 hypothetical protein [Enterococcus faecalis EX166083VC21]HAP5029391.1 hypothetical protein [Enterococcus faecalis EX166083VC18]HAP5032241.1 hypothetical protein [Enterococcus faecalis EX166083VC17]HAP5034899.1 hypothetical pro
MSQCFKQKRKNLSIIEQILSFFMLYVKKLIELFQIYDSNCSIFSKGLNCFDRQLGFKKFKNEIIEKNENRLKTSFNFFEKKC